MSGIAIYVPGVDWSARGLGQVTPTEQIPIESLVVEGPATITGTGRYYIRPFPVFTNQRQVNWSIVSGSAYAVISSGGVVTAQAAAGSGHNVTIRATSVYNSAIYADKTINVAAAGDYTYYDWIQSDGTAYIVVPRSAGFYQVGGVMTWRGTIQTENGYAFAHNRGGSANSPWQIAAYGQNSTQKYAVQLGTLGYTPVLDSPTFSATRWVRYKFTLSTSESATNGKLEFITDNDGIVRATKSNAGIYLDGGFAFFVGANLFPNGSVSVWANTNSTNKMRGFTVEDVNGVTLMDLRPATFNGVPGLHDVISGAFYTNYNSAGVLTVGN